MAEDNVTVGVGGAIDKSVGVYFIDPGEAVQAVSSSASDTTPIVTLTYRDAENPSLFVEHAFTLTGVTPVPPSFAALASCLKAVKSATAAGDVALEGLTAIRVGTAQAGGPRSITLDLLASRLDGFYAGLIVRITGGTGAGQIRQAYAYEGSSYTIFVDRDWATPPDSTSIFRLSKGLYFEKAPTEIMTVRRIFYNASGDDLSDDGALFEKLFLCNVHATESFRGGAVRQARDPSRLVGHGAATTINDTVTSATRRAPPAGITFGDAGQSIPAVVAPAAASAVWWRLRGTYASGIPVSLTTFAPEVIGS